MQRRNITDMIGPPLGEDRLESNRRTKRNGTTLEKMKRNARKVAEDEGAEERVDANWQIEARVSGKPIWSFLLRK